MLTEQRAPELDPSLSVPAYPAAALPVVTCADTLGVHFAGEDILGVYSGKSVDETVAASPLADLYSGRRSYFAIENLTRYGYLDVKRAREARE